MVFLHKTARMVVFPKAKINLGLRITSKREDGYHDIETIFYPVNLCDALEFVISPRVDRDDELSVSGISTGEPSENNLVMRAVKMMRKQFSFPPLKIHLHKTIPIGAGLGGGSSDAAGIITGIARYFNLPAEITTLKAIALELGSDCPYFIENLPSLATGRGEIMEPLETFLIGYYILLLNPGIHISTRDAYHNCYPEHPSTELIRLVREPVNEWKNTIFNDFEKSVFKKYPQIANIKKALYESGAIYSAMSGSGSTVYGIYTSPPQIPEILKEYVIYNGCL
jgi:4-diphosphocytidyl-2-C-methyl-D-erythritol kinase